MAGVEQSMGRARAMRHSKVFGILYRLRLGFKPESGFTSLVRLFGRSASCSYRHLTPVRTRVQGGVADLRSASPRQGADLRAGGQPLA